MYIYIWSNHSYIPRVQPQSQDYKLSMSKHERIFIIFILKKEWLKKKLYNIYIAISNYKSYFIYIYIYIWFNHPKGATPISSGLQILRVKA